MLTPVSALPSSHPRVLVTGARGFVGTALCARLAKDGYPVVRAVRSQAAIPQEIAVGCIDSATDWSPLLTDVQAVIHLAARVHVMHKEDGNVLEAYRAVNVQGTKRLALAAAAAGVKRFVFVSSIKVNGEQTVATPFSEADQPNPQGAYAVSKVEAEQVLWKVAGASGMEVVILRPPLVYGPGVKANFLRLLRWVDRGVPLLLAFAHNRRSMIYLGNLVDALIACVERPDAAGKTFLVSDDEDVSTARLISIIAETMGKSSRLWPFPLPALRLFGRLADKAIETDRLLGSLQIDSSYIRKELGWSPPYTLRQGLEETVQAFRAGDGATPS